MGDLRPSFRVKGELLTMSDYTLLAVSVAHPGYERMIRSLSPKRRLSRRGIEIKPIARRRVRRINAELLRKFI